jgi:hypothetical protein
MSQLATVQREFRDYVLRRDPTIAGKVTGTARADASTRLEIYANAYRLRLLEVLQLDYEALHALIGDGEFDSLGRAYIDHYPSVYPNIRWIGGNMCRFLRENTPYCTHPVLAEMAEFEWALRSAFDAGDVDPLTVDEVAAIPADAWPTMRPVLQPSVQRMNFAWDTVTLWKAIDADELPPQPRELDLAMGWVVWRKGLAPQFRSLEVDEAAALDAVLRRQPFTVICEGLCEWIDAQHVALRAATLLKTWVSEGMIAALETD